MYWFIPHSWPWCALPWTGPCSHLPWPHAGWVTWTSQGAAGTWQGIRLRFGSSEISKLLALLLHWECQRKSCQSRRCPHLPPDPHKMESMGSGSLSSAVSNSVTFGPESPLDRAWLPRRSKECCQCTQSFSVSQWFWDTGNEAAMHGIAFARQKFLILASDGPSKTARGSTVSHFLGTVTKQPPVAQLPQCLGAICIRIPPDTRHMVMCKSLPHHRSGGLALGMASMPSVPSNSMDQYLGGNHLCWDHGPIAAIAAIAHWSRGQSGALVWTATITRKAAHGLGRWPNAHVVLQLRSKLGSQRSSHEPCRPGRTAPCLHLNSGLNQTSYKILKCPPFARLRVRSSTQDSHRLCLAAKLLSPP